VNGEGFYTVAKNVNLHLMSQILKAHVNSLLRKMALFYRISHGLFGKI